MHIDILGAPIGIGVESHRADARAHLQLPRYFVRAGINDIDHAALNRASNGVAPVGGYVNVMNGAIHRDRFDISE